ncbi:MAG: tyrosine-type recombinase/integrase [Rhizobiaceae bacterium]
MKKALTDREVKALKPQDNRYVISDAVIPGLRLRVMPTGSKIFAFDITIPKTITGTESLRRTHKLGTYPTITLADARRLSNEIAVEVGRGIDRVAEAEKQAADAVIKTKTQKTMSEVIKLYLDSRDKKKRIGELEKLLLVAFADYLETPITEMTDTMVKQISDDRKRNLSDIEVRQMVKATGLRMSNDRADALTDHQLYRIIGRGRGAAPVVSRRILVYSVAIFRFARSERFTEQNVMDGIIPPKKPQTAPQRQLTIKEVRTIWEATTKLAPQWRDLIQLLLLTAARRNEIAKLRTSHVDIEKHMLKIPDTKNGTEHLIPLCDHGLSIVKKYLRDDDGFIFTNTDGQTPVSGFSKVKIRLDDFAGITGWKLHDFRRAFVSLMAEERIPIHVVDRCLNHSATASRVSGAQDSYLLYNFIDERRLALEAWSNLVIHGEKFSAQNVVQLRV